MNIYTKNDEALSIALLVNSEDLARRFEAENHSQSFLPTWRLMANEFVPIVRRRSSHKKLTLDMLRWGLRVESEIYPDAIQFQSAIQHAQPIYEQSFSQRCLIPVNMLYSCWSGETKSSNGTFAFGRNYISSVALAGVWVLQKFRGESTERFFILNSQDLKNRKIFNPILVTEGCWSSWLGITSTGVTEIVSPYTLLGSAKDIYLPSSVVCSSLSNSRG
jgi:putative SOS response-associated peptidase YedK